ncbi:hypothetical protein [Oceanobacillus salinisoli]|uniref:hypothetical protein n=1 Tax=Oceanobacillus salinisoli TaxID=2678611 RepID=UPI0012E2424A|nr:hypothetical protein [Oceanobacillus salinisoli]
MLTPFKVLLPERILNKSNKDDLWSDTLDYMLRYPHYHLIDIEGKYAICERKTVKGDRNGKI